MPTEASDSELVEASSSGLLFAYSGSPPLASALEWPSGNEDISRSSSFLTLADDMRNGTAQPTNAHAIVPYVRPQACCQTLLLALHCQALLSSDSTVQLQKISLLELFTCGPVVQVRCALAAAERPWLLLLARRLCLAVHWNGEVLKAGHRRR